MDFPTSSAASETLAITPALPELLAPAGNWDCAKAAVENGADAIYFGLGQPRLPAQPSGSLGPGGSPGTHSNRGELPQNRRPSQSAGIRRQRHPRLPPGVGSVGGQGKPTPTAPRRESTPTPPRRGSTSHLLNFLLSLLPTHPLIHPPTPSPLPTSPSSAPAPSSPPPPRRGLRRSTANLKTRRPTKRRWTGFGPIAFRILRLFG